MCKSADSITDIVHALKNSTDHVIMNKDPTMIVLFAYSSFENPVVVNRAEILALAKQAKASTNDEEEDGPPHPNTYSPIHFIGN